jgi:hypothetical protein
LFDRQVVRTCYILLELMISKCCGSFVGALRLPIYKLTIMSTVLTIMSTVLVKEWCGKSIKSQGCEGFDKMLNVRTNLTGLDWLTLH